MLSAWIILWLLVVAVVQVAVVVRVDFWQAQRMPSLRETLQLLLLVVVALQGRKQVQVLPRELTLHFIL
jgi:hypothetical protein